jgi:hypothetical protein
MTKKTLEGIVGTLVTEALLQVTAGQPDEYKPTPNDEAEARQIVGMTIRNNKQKLVEGFPKSGSI